MSDIAEIVKKSLYRFFHGIDWEDELPSKSLGTQNNTLHPLTKWVEHYRSKYPPMEKYAFPPPTSTSLYTSLSGVIFTEAAVE